MGLGAGTLFLMTPKRGTEAKGQGSFRWGVCDIGVTPVYSVFFLGTEYKLCSSDFF